jgi:DNA-binding transcriptional ArsR family regulator
MQTLTTIAAVIRKYRKSYCVASQEKLIELLGTYYQVSIRHRMLNYHLADLRKLGLIKSIKRTHRKSDGTICLQTTATCLTPLGYYELWKLGCEWARRKYDSLIKKYCPKLQYGKKAAADPQDTEVRRRRDLVPEMFQNPEFRKAFGLDEKQTLGRPQF